MDEKAEILLVDDNLADVKLAMHALQRRGGAVEIAVTRDGEEALDFLFHRGRYADGLAGRSVRLILLDLKLPKVNGFEVLRTIKSDESKRAIPIVVLSSSNQDRDLRECYRLGANSYVQKPVDFDRYEELVALIKSYWLTVNHLPLPEGTAEIRRREGQR